MPLKLEKYSDEFESQVAEYHTGNREDRSEKATMDLYTRVAHAEGFFQACKRYIDIFGKRVIDVGCGTGAISAAAAFMGADVSACELPDKPLELTRRRWQENEIAGDLFRYDLTEPLPSRLVGRFDFVFCYQILEHIPRIAQFRALANLFRMAAPEGFVFIDTENSLAPYDRHDTQTWLLRYLTNRVAADIVKKLGRALNHPEPSWGGGRDNSRLSLL